MGQADLKTSNLNNVRIFHRMSRTFSYAYEGRSHIYCMQVSTCVGVSSGFRSFLWSTSTALSYSLSTVAANVELLGPPADGEAESPLNGWGPGGENTPCGPVETCDPEGAADKLDPWGDWVVELCWKTVRLSCLIWDKSLVSMLDKSVVTCVITCCASICAAALIGAVKLAANGEKLFVFCASKCSSA